MTMIKSTNSLSILEVEIDTNDNLFDLIAYLYEKIYGHKFLPKEIARLNHYEFWWDDFDDVVDNHTSDASPVVREAIEYIASTEEYASCNIIRIE